MLFLLFWCFMKFLALWHIWIPVYWTGGLLLLGFLPRWDWSLRHVYNNSTIISSFSLLNAVTIMKNMIQWSQWSRMICKVNLDKQRTLCPWLINETKTEVELNIERQKTRRQSIQYNTKQNNLLIGPFGKWSVCVLAGIQICVNGWVASPTQVPIALWPSPH
jgi:hypothetical protein